MISTAKRGGDGAVKKQSFCMVLKLVSWYKFNLECYISLGCKFYLHANFTHKKIVVEYTQRKMRKKFKCFFTKQIISTK